MTDIVLLTTNSKRENYSITADKYSAPGGFANHSINISKPKYNSLVI